MTRTLEDTARAHGDGLDLRPQVAGVSADPVRTRRRPLLVVLGITLTCLGGLSAAWLATTAAKTTGVLVVTSAVSAGEVLTAADLAAASLSSDPSVRSVPSSDLDSVVGRRAAVSLVPGQVLPPQAVTDTLTPPAGQSLVGVAVSPLQMPSGPLAGGAQVLLVGTPNPQDPPPAAVARGINATVVDVEPVPDTDKKVINVRLPAALAPVLAAQVATGRISVVVLSAAKGG